LLLEVSTGSFAVGLKVYTRWAHTNPTDGAFRANQPFDVAMNACNAGSEGLVAKRYKNFPSRREPKESPAVIPQPASERLPPSRTNDET